MSSPPIKTTGTTAPLHLILGDEEFLVDRAVREVLRSARLTDPQTDLRRIRLPDMAINELAELLSPSLFAQGQVLVLESANEAAADLLDRVRDYGTQPVDGVTLVVLHSGGGRSKAAKELPNALRKAGAKVVECPKITKAADRETFVREEVRRAGGRIDAGAVATLIDAIGSDLRELAASVSQLVADTKGSIDSTVVRQYHQGKAEVTGFTVAEKAVVGDQSGAMEALRWAMHLGVAQVLLADALADAVRTVALVASAGRGDSFQLASTLGMPPWKVKKAQTQAAGWTPRGLATAMRVVADLNAEVKGAAANADYALERAVLNVVAARGQR